MIYVIIGVIVIVIGLSSELPLGWVAGLSGGVIIIILQRILVIIRGIHHKLLGLPLTQSQVETLIKHTRKYPMMSSQFEVHPWEKTVYPHVQLDGYTYVRALAFYKYLSQTGTRYRFELPNREPIELECADAYYPQVSLFEHGDMAFVRVDSLGLQIDIRGGVAYIEDSG